MANEWQYEMQAEEAAEKDVEATAKKIREAIDTVERWLKAYSRQNQDGSQLGFFGFYRPVLSRHLFLLLHCRRAGKRH